ncbi:hypothetical protein LEP1GSC150_4047 [Leptospira interrogans serovar Copenhageni str. LT2050]|uniref:Uncharacterized protein n=1 Tax=Leptospira interrogans serovar Copenhageni str. LT2050 TaxID=1001598 RepID=M3HW30_LEPIT|nr:hypothetical protein LEP1GSC150_4047 [Leptospira interrogans serovar Copenhageni str. LT2050]
MERVALLLQEVDSVYDTNELRKIISFYEELSGISYEDKTLSEISEKKITISKFHHKFETKQNQFKIAGKPRLEW